MNAIRIIIRLIGVSLGVALIGLAGFALYRSSQPIPLPQHTWFVAQDPNQSVEAWKPDEGWRSNTVYIPSLSVTMPFVDAGEQNGWLALERGRTDSGVRFVGSGTVDKGSMMVAAHVNNNRLEYGPFVHLSEVGPGTPIYVTGADAVPHTYAADSINVFLKDEVPPSVGDPDGPPRLALITCGGPIITGSNGYQHYASNVVVTAAQLGR